jgi:hypothetical protein
MSAGSKIQTVAQSPDPPDEMTFTEIMTDLYADHAPGNLLECAIVDAMALNRWRAIRLYSLHLGHANHKLRHAAAVLEYRFYSAYQRLLRSQQVKRSPTPAAQRALRERTQSLGKR